MSSIPSEVVVPSPSTDADSSPNPVLNPGFITCDDAATFLHESFKRLPGTEFTGFVLKNEDGRFYCAQETTPADENADAQNTLDILLTITKNSKDEWISPSGYTLEARLFPHSGKIKGIDESLVEWGQRQLFFSVADLFEVMTWRRKYSRCYLSLSDGALICYTSTDSAFEQELSPRFGRTPDGRLQTFESLYDAGGIPSSILILLAVAAGVVTTVVSGNLWRRRGRVKASWRRDILQQNPPVEMMPVCGPILQDASEVGRYLHEQMLALSPAQQHVGIVLKHTTEDFFVVTAPVRSDYATFDRQVLFPRDRHGNFGLPAGFRVHGFYHSMSPISHGEPSTQLERSKNFFSVKDLRVGLSRMHVAPHHRLFLCAPDGAVLRFAKPDSEKVVRLMAQLHSQSADGVLSQAFIDLVAAAGTLSVLYSSSTWPKGRVSPSTMG